MRTHNFIGSIMLGLSSLHRLALPLAVATATFAGACAEPEEIDRVQPDLIKKSDLEGEWYSLGTVVRAPFASHYVFPGLQGTLERGIWEVQEKALVFYRTYEAVENADQQGVRSDVDTPLLDKDGNPITYDKTMPDGTVKKATRYVYRAAPIKKYSVIGHYDVRKQYNTMTGEEGNVLVEDASEKFWYQRDYVRVDFGANGATNFADMSFSQSLPPTMTVYEGEEAPDDLKFNKSADGKYMDFVVRGLVLAPQEYFEGYGYVPTCLFYPWYTGAYYECDEEEIHIRSSFMKVPETNSYKPLDWNDQMLNKFGYYRSARSDWDEFYGETYSGADRYIRRFRIWKDYVVGADGKLDYSKMEPNPVVYYLSENFPRELIRGAKDLADQWNEPFQEVVETRMNKEYDGRMFVLCENSQAEADAARAADPNAVIAETDARWCKDMDQPKRMGDLRYNLLDSVNEPVQYGLYGYGPMHSDPITGETIHANAHQYTANLRLGARTAVDMIEYEAGVQNFRDITEARHIETELKAKRIRGTQGGPHIVSSADASAYTDEAAGVIPADISMQMAANGFQSTDLDLAAAGMNRLLGSDEYSYLWLNEDMASMVGMPLEHLGTQSGQNAKMLDNFVNPANLGSERMLSWKMEQDTHDGQATMCKREFFDDSFRGLALEYKVKYDQAVCEGLLAQEQAGADLAFDFNVFKQPGAKCDDDASVCGAGSTCQFVDQGDVKGNYCITSCSAGALFDQLRNEIRRVNQITTATYWDPNALYTETKDARVEASQLAARTIVEKIREETFLDVYDRMWSTVAMHEVGHNVGFRHNFASSTDALNFFPGYWDRKGHDENGTWKPYNLFETDTESQTVNHMREYQQTSIMEYSSSFNARYQGLGAYDRAGVLYGYGELVEVFENPPAFDSWSKYLADPSDENPDQFPVETRREQPLAKALRKVHHTNYPNLFGGVDKLLDRKVVDAYETADMGKPCSQHDNPYDTNVCGGGGSFCAPYPNGYYCTKPNMLEVPFRFCSDEYNWTTPSCQTWDEGVDPFEIVNNSIADYEAYWPFWAYKRDNDLFNPSTSYWGRVVYEMYGYRKQFEHWALDYARYNHNDWWQKQYGKPWHLDENGGLGATLAAKMIFEHLANIFGRPSDGWYGFNTNRKTYEPMVDNGFNRYTNPIQLREDVGARPIYPSYDFSGYIYTPYRAGTFYDRLAAMMYMTYPTTMFTVGIDRTYDVKRFRLNMASVWPQRVQNLFAGIIAGRPEMYGWCIEHDGLPPTEVDAQGRPGTGDPTLVKPRIWFGTQEELDDWYSNCVPLDPEPLYDFPTTQYRLPAIAAVYGFGWMGGTFDKSFTDRNRLWLEGDGSDVSIPPGFTKVTFTEPNSGKTYVAAYDPNEEDPYAAVDTRHIVPADDFEDHAVTFWPAARLVVEAQRRLDAAVQFNTPEYERSYKEIIGRLEILRGLYRYFDFGF